jgi:stage V sporulation protein T
MESSAAMIDQLNADLAKETDNVTETEQSADNLAVVLIELQEELKITMRQRIRDILKHPEQEALLEQTYDELEGELQKKIQGLNHQIDMLSDKRNTILRVNRVAKTALDVFQDILDKQTLERNDLELMISQVKVYEDHLEIQLQPDIDALLHAGVMEVATNFEAGTENIEQATIVQRSEKHTDKVFRANVISGGDPLEIFTDKDGEVIFKKYSPVGELTEFAQQICEALSRTTGAVSAICDRDTIVAAAGAGSRALEGREISSRLSRIMDARGLYTNGSGAEVVYPAEGEESLAVAVASPVLAEGDLIGCVMFLGAENIKPELLEIRLAQAMSGFLGRQLEN